MADFIRENRWFFLPSLTFLLACLVGTLVVPYGNEILFFNQFRIEPFNLIFSFWTKLGEENIYFVAIFCLAAFFSFRSAALVLLVGLTVLPLAYFSKQVVPTDRPFAFFEKSHRLSEVVFVPKIDIFKGNTSFPSGHTMSAFAFWGCLAFVSRRRKWVDFGCAVAAIGVGTSRIFLGQHFLMDVGAGGSLGLLIFMTFWRVSQSSWFLQGGFWKLNFRRIERR